MITLHFYIIFILQQMHQNILLLSEDVIH